MSSPDITRDPTEPTLPEDVDDEYEMTPAELWTKIVELAKATELGAQDLQDQLRDFNKSAL